MARLVLLLLVLAGFGVARAQTPGSASGILAADGASVRLTNAYAQQMVEAQEGRLGAGPSRLVLLVTGQPLGPGTSGAAFLASARGGPVRGLVLTLTGGGERVLSAAVAGGQGRVLTQVFGAETVRIEGVQRFGNSISGRIVAANAPEPTFDVRFSAPIAAAPPWPAPLTGAAARESAPAQAYAAFLAALARKDAPAARAAFAPDHPAQAQVASVALSAWRGEYLPREAAPAAVMGTLAKVYQQDDHAVLVFGSGRDAVSRQLVRTAQGWKVAA
ncbi:MAG: hypothetical protein NVSMB18_26310 [Acetobacteraceae bacterium]